MSGQRDGSPLRKGVLIGAGYFSQFHGDAWSRSERAELTAVCDLDPQRAEAFAKTHQIPRHYADVATMLDAESPDFVDIVTRPDTHLHLTQQVAETGADIICQKPVAPSFDEAQELVRAAKDAGVRLMIHENFRFQPWYRTIRRLIEEGAVGDRLHSISIRTRTGDGWQEDAYLARQPYFREMPRFLIFETGVHFIDTLRYLAGEITSVYAQLRTLNPAMAGEDAGVLLFEFADGATGIWDANRFNETNAADARYTFGETLVEGNGGTLRLDGSGRLTLQRLGEHEHEVDYAHEPRNFAGDCVMATQEHFLDCLESGMPFETSGEAYLRTLAVQEAAYTSAATGQPVRNLTFSDEGH